MRGLSQHRPHMPALDIPDITVPKVSAHSPWACVRGGGGPGVSCDVQAARFAEPPPAALVAGGPEMPRRGVEGLRRRREGALGGSDVAVWARAVVDVHAQRVG